MDQKQQRIVGLDAMKTMAILFVVMYHAGAGAQAAARMQESSQDIIPLLNYLFTGILSMCIPLFFLVNGFLLFGRPLNIKRHIRKIITLIVLTVIWNILTQFFMIAVRQWQSLSPDQIVSNIWHLQPQLNNHLWFMPALVVLYCFFPLMKSAYDHERSWFRMFLVVACLCTFSMVLLNMLLHGIQLLTQGTVGDLSSMVPWGDDFWGEFNPLRGVYGYSFVYFMLGGVLAEYQFRNQNQNACHVTRNAAVVFSGAIVLYFLYNLMMFYGGQRNQDVVWNGYDSPLIAAAIVSLFFLIRNFSPKGMLRRIIIFIGSNTLGVYFIHWLLVAGLRTIDISFTEVFTHTIAAYAVEGFLVLVASCILCWLIRKIPVVRQLIFL